MRFQSEVIFLGSEPRESKKTGKPYYMAKFMYEPTKEIYDMYVPSDKVQLVTNLAKCEMFKKVCATFAINAFNGKAQVDLQGLEF